MGAISGITSECVMVMDRWARKHPISSSLDYLNWWVNMLLTTLKELINSLLVMKNTNRFSISLLFNATKNWTIQTSM